MPLCSAEPGKKLPCTEWSVYKATQDAQHPLCVLRWALLWPRRQHKAVLQSLINSAMLCWSQGDVCRDTCGTWEATHGQRTPTAGTKGKWDLRFSDSLYKEPQSSSFCIHKVSRGFQLKKKFLKVLGSESSSSLHTEEQLCWELWAMGPRLKMELFSQLMTGAVLTANTVTVEKM